MALPAMVLYFPSYQGKLVNVANATSMVIKALKLEIAL